MWDECFRIYGLEITRPSRRNDLGLHRAVPISDKRTSQKAKIAA